MLLQLVVDLQYPTVLPSMASQEINIHAPKVSHACRDYLNNLEISRETNSIIIMTIIVTHIFHIWCRKHIPFDG